MVQGRDSTRATIFSHGSRKVNYGCRMVVYDKLDEGQKETDRREDDRRISGHGVCSARRTRSSNNGVTRNQTTKLQRTLNAGTKTNRRHPASRYLGQWHVSVFYGWNRRTMPDHSNEPVCDRSPNRKTISKILGRRSPSGLHRAPENLFVLWKKSLGTTRFLDNFHWSLIAFISCFNRTRDRRRRRLIRLDPYFFGGSSFAQPGERGRKRFAFFDRSAAPVTSR